MRKLPAIVTSVVAAAMMAAFLMAGCAGKDGAAGAAGADGADASGACKECHSSDQTLVAHEFEWSLHKHGSGETFAEEAGNSCAQRCHNGAGYLAFVSGTPAALPGSMSTTPINCRTCHMVHTAYDTTDWRLTNVAPVKLVIDTTLPPLDLGKSNLCATCHQSRTNPLVAVDSSPKYATPKDTVKLGTRFGGHHGPVANIKGGVGGWENGVTPEFGPIHKATGCITCHVSAENGQNHQFIPALATCNLATCHGAGGIKGSASAGFIKGTDSVQVHFQKLLDQVRDTLVGRGALVLAGMDTASLDSLGEVGLKMADENAEHLEHNPEASLFPFASVPRRVPRAVAGLAFNFWMLTEDRSLGIHNLDYSLSLLHTALTAVNPAIVPVY